METRLGPAGLQVDPVFQHSWRHYVGFVRDLVKGWFRRVCRRCVEHVGLFFVAKKAVAQRSIIDARASNRHFLRPPFGPFLTGKGLCHVAGQGAPEDAQIWFVGWADIKDAAHQMWIPGWLRAFFASRIRSWLHRKNDRSKTSCSRVCEKSCPCDISMGFSWALFFSYRMS